MILIRSGVINTRATSIPRKAVTEIQMASWCLIRRFNVALNVLSLISNFVFAFPLKVVYRICLSSSCEIIVFFSEDDIALPTSILDSFGFLTAQFEKISRIIIPKRYFLFLIFFIFYLFF